MGSHARLGRGSPFFLLDSGLLDSILKMTFRPIRPYFIRYKDAWGALPPGVCAWITRLYLDAKEQHDAEQAQETAETQARYAAMAMWPRPAFIRTSPGPAPYCLKPQVHSSAEHTIDGRQFECRIWACSR